MVKTVRFNIHRKCFNGITTDSLGNAYVTGYTMGGMDGHTNSGQDDLFITKFSASGENYGQSNLEQHLMIMLKELPDIEGNIFITGYSGGDLEGETGNGKEDIFLMKLSSGIPSLKLNTGELKTMPFMINGSSFSLYSAIRRCIK